MELFVAPRHTIAATKLPLVGTDVPRFQKGETRAIVHSFIKYKDVFGVDRVSEITIEMVRNGERVNVRNGEPDVIEPQYERQPVGTQNRAE